MAPRPPPAVHSRRARPQPGRDGGRAGRRAPNVRRVRSSARSRDDGDVIRARLRALLAEGQRTGGWVPEEDEDDDAVDDGGPDSSEDDGDADRDVPDPSATDDAALPSGLGRHRAPGRTTRLDPGGPGSWSLWVVGVLAAAAVLGWTWLDRPSVQQVPVGSSASAALSHAPSSPPSPPPPPSAPADTGSIGSVVVSVVGQVAAPGLVTLPAGARVADALAAAGGLLPEADPASINAAAVLSDGQQIAVGVPGAAGQPTAAGDAGVSGPLNLNSATVADLDALPGIGPVLAQRIVDHRTAHGPFTSVDQLNDVSGIGPAIFADLADRVRV
jgi:comEA protein